MLRVEKVMKMRNWLVFFALLLLGCDNDVALVANPDIGQAPAPDESEWTVRVTVPFPIVDVVWDGQVFVAVGSRGAVLTSVDGIDWVAKESIDDGLNAIAAFGSDIYAAGDSTILLSTDHGETWTVIARPDFPGHVVVADSSRVIVTGTVGDMFVPRILISEDRGNTWQDAAGFFWWVSDLIYRDGLFVAPAGCWTPDRGAIGTCVIVSADAKQWNEIFFSEEVPRLDAVVDADNQLFVAGDNGTVYSSFDALNWTELSTPREDVNYSGGAWHGTRLIFVGGSIGISSTDGGASWDTFRIDAGYQSAAMAWGNGRFVSVGRLMNSDEGAIYTTD